MPSKKIYAWRFSIPFVALVIGTTSARPSIKRKGESGENQNQHQEQAKGAVGACAGRSSQQKTNGLQPKESLQIRPDYYYRIYAEIRNVSACAGAVNLLCGSSLYY
jgi:hypothetical protein